MKFLLKYTKSNLIEAKNDIKYLDLLSENKNKIDDISKDWNKIKKKIHDYEFIYTSPNRRKNISSIIPISRSYFKLKEIVKDYSIPLDNTFVLCMAEAPGGFIQEILENKHIIKIYANTLKNDDVSVPKWNLKLSNNKKIDFYYGIKGDGNLVDIDNILSYIKYIGRGTINLVTGDGGFDYSEDYNKQEYNSVPLIYSEIFLALNVLKKGGDFICKIFDSFLKNTIQLIYLLTISFDKVYIHKPKCSRLSNSEKYLVCIGYKGYNKDIINELFRNYETKILSTKIDSNFYLKIQEFISQYINIQIDQINKGIDIIHSNQTINTPTNDQIKIAKEWCLKYGIEINENCYYINGQSEQVDFKMGVE